LDEAAGKKEYDALKLEITHTQDGIRKLEDEILEAMAETEDRAAALPGVEKELQEAKKQRDNFDKESQAKSVELNQQREDVLAKLKAEEDKLPEDARALYDRLIKAHGADALSAVEGRICVACYTEITQQNYNELRNGIFVPCKNCGRVLYLSE